MDARTEAISQPDLTGMGGSNTTRRGLVYNRFRGPLGNVGCAFVGGADLSSLSKTTLATLTNPDALAINQDSLGLQAVQVSESSPGLQVWSKLLSTSGERAALLLNLTDTCCVTTFNFGDLGLSGPSASIKNVCSGKAIGEFNFYYSDTVLAKDPVDRAVRIQLPLNAANEILSFMQPAIPGTRIKSIFVP